MVVHVIVAALVVSPEALTELITGGTVSAAGVTVTDAVFVPFRVAVRVTV